jgi:glycosyltransferase involved in cell wall biosynthesis
VTAGVSFVIPVLNGGALLHRCLDSIAAQDFASERIEVLVMDGGSTDGTRQLVQSLGFEVVENPLRLAEPGVKLGLSRARHEIRVVMAADNALPRTDWLSRVVETFERTSARGVFTHVVHAPADSSFCRYFNHLHADPFNWFVFGAAANPRRFGEVYPRLETGPGYEVLDLRAGEPPLLALAQAFALRGELPQGEHEQDDILPLWQMIETGQRFAYVDAGVLHHTVRGFRDFLRKYSRRAAAAMAAEDAAHRQRHHVLSRRRRLRRLLWVPYSLSVVAPALDAARHFARDRNPLWAWHPVACFALGIVMVRVVLEHALAKR